MCMVVCSIHRLGDVMAIVYQMLVASVVADIRAEVLSADFVVTRMTIRLDLNSHLYTQMQPT